MLKPASAAALLKTDPLGIRAEEPLYFVEELPGANTQGATLEEARANLQEAVHLVFEANRGLAEETIKGQAVIGEPLRISA